MCAKKNMYYKGVEDESDQDQMSESVLIPGVEHEMRDGFSGQDTEKDDENRA